MKEDKFNIHIRAWGSGNIIWIIGLATILGVNVSSYLFLLYVLLIPASWVLISNERARKQK